VDVRAGAALTRALVTGARGQDGSYLVELLQAKGYGVAQVDRGDADLADPEQVRALVRDAAPDEIYNLAAVTFPPTVWDEPVESVRTGVAVVALLEAVRTEAPAARLFHASSAEVFGAPADAPQSEATPYRPVSLYGAIKAFDDFAVAAYRERYGLHASCGIMFNHESPRRRTEFLPAKVAHGVAAIRAGRERELTLGDLEARRDWGYAPDYVEAMWRMLQQDEPDDYVIATGEAHSVGELVELAFAHAGLDWRDHVRVDQALVRGDARLLVGDATKARTRLGWRPSVTFEELVRLLVDAAAAA
jgi:GDPmannose 4,6-dehydratase